MATCRIARMFHSVTKQKAGVAMAPFVQLGIDKCRKIETNPLLRRTHAHLSSIPATLFRNQSWKRTHLGFQSSTRAAISVSSAFRKTKPSTMVWLGDRQKRKTNPGRCTTNSVSSCGNLFSKAFCETKPPLRSREGIDESEGTKPMRTAPN